MPHRSRTRTWLAGTVTTALLGAAGAVQASPQPAPEPTGPDRPASTATLPDAVHSLTLITGDVVTHTEHADGVVTTDVEPVGDGGFRSQVVGEDTYVIPDAALPHLAAGTLDRDLFNITSLIEQGYADEDRATLPVIVQYAAGSRATAAVPDGANVTAHLESLDAQAMEANKTQAAAFWADVTSGVAPGSDRLAHGITAIHLDGMVEASLADSVTQVGAPEAWERGLDGSGITVAVLDTGADLDHPDLLDVIVDSRSFVPDQDVTDVNGHGTHVASTVAGSGTASEGANRGVAPGADLVIGKVLDDSGSGLNSWIIEGMEWAAAEADVVNMSLGSYEPSDGTDPMALAVEALSEDTGALFVIAAGNYGRAGGIGSPGAAESALTVGAVDSEDQRADFQDMGPRLGDALVKPDLTAPGVDVNAARSQDSGGEGWYTPMDGTSMATPHVAGAAAILAQQHPDWSGQQLKEGLMSSALALPEDGPYQVGSGRLDVPASLDAPVVASGPLSFGFFDWPHGGDPAVEREITYTNRTDAEVLLDLTADGGGSEGEALPDGLIELGAAQLAVPARGTATVTVTMTPDLAPAPSTISGYVVASTAGEPVARTGWGMVKEDERYELTIRATDRDGSSALAYVTIKEAGNPYPTHVTVDGETRLRLSANSYSAMSFMEVHDGPDSLGVAMLGDPLVELTGDRVVHLDAREANEVTVEVDDEGLVPTYQRMEYFVSAVDMNELYQIPPDVDTLYAAPTVEVAEGDFEYFTRWRLRTPLVEVRDQGQPLDTVPFYGSGYPQVQGDLPAVYAGTGTAEDLAGIDAEGAAVVITRDQDADLGEIGERVDEAGAELLVVVNDEPAEFVDALVPPSGHPVRMPVVGISGVEGAGLVPRVQAGGVELALGGGASSPVVYDLVDPHVGSIPDDVAYAPGPDELARIDTTYHADRDRAGAEFRYDFRPHSFRGWGDPTDMGLPAERVEWVSAQEGTSWYQDAWTLDGQWNERGIRRGYEPGERTSDRWFASVVHPRLGEGYWGPNRQDNFLQANLPGWAGSGEGHTGGMGMSDGTSPQRIRWYAGEQLLEESVGWQSSWVELPSGERTQLRLVNEDSREADLWTTSLATRTEWTFWTEGPGPEDPFQIELPFLQVGFDVATGPGVTALEREHTLGLSAWHLPGVTGAGQVTEGSLEVSYDDGATWTQVALSGEAPAWTADLVPPAEAEHVSLRASAVDTEGNAIVQEIERAYLLPEEVAVPEVSRIGGLNRYETAALIAQEYPEGARTVYVVTGQGFADALSGSAPASRGLVPGSVGTLQTPDDEPAPVLLVRHGRIPASTAAALDALMPETVVVLGGEAAVSAAVEQQLSAWAQVERIAGKDRYETAALLAGFYPAGLEQVYVASGEDAHFPDALTGAALAGHQGVPVLLTRSDSVPSSVLEALQRLDAQQVVVLGGTGAVTGEVYDAVGGTSRLAGPTRYETAVAISQEYAAGAGSTLVATGQAWPDALTGSALAGDLGVPVILTRPSELPDAVRSELRRLTPGGVAILGGEAAVSAAVEQELEDLLAERAE